MIKLMDLLEDSFEQSADIMGMIEFYKRAEPEAQVEMERLINDGDWKAVHDLIEKTTKTHIVSFTQNNSWRASRKGAS
jgi:hypothetical protein